MSRKLTEVNRRSRGAREALNEIDYVDQLNVEEELWLQTFMRATTGNSIEDMATLVGQDPVKLEKLKTEIFSEDNARRRDIMGAGNRIACGVTDLDQVETSALGDIRSAGFASLRCNRCMKKAARCRCDIRQRKGQYSQSDYLAPEDTEESIQGAIDLRRRMEAYDLLPTGDAPKGLKQGHTVKICLPRHILNGAWGYVLDYCPNRGAYLIRSMSKEGLKNRDGSTPKATVAWIRPEGLKRYSLHPAPKVSGKRSDKTSGGKNEH